ncbi:MAG: hypothetical protein AUG44_08665 [Actinobacteria bacterium 13_1_20CM_3_71_11]|nr:MAG: hypothetical protein AUG44_08665 [Actinobacteria bacterium 13_1_20CM_3_71_11]
MMTEKELHIQQAEGLEKLAAMIRENPDLADELTYTLENLLVPLIGDEQKPMMAKFARAAARGRIKHEKDASNSFFELKLWFGPVKLQVSADREQVCERVVVGTETVTKKVKDPDALAAVPEVEVTETVEQVEWRCVPLLASTKDGGE